MMNKLLTFIFCGLSLCLVMAKFANFTQKQITLNPAQTAFLLQAIGAQSSDHLSTVLQWGGSSHQATLFQYTSDPVPSFVFNGSFMDEETSSGNPVPQYTIQSDVIPLKSNTTDEWTKIFHDLGLQKLSTASWSRGGKRIYFKKYDANDGLILVSIYGLKAGYQIRIGLDLRNARDRAKR